MRIVPILLAGALAASLGACATATRGTSQDWAVNTYPSGAAVTTSNGMQCPTTPCTLRMSRNSRFVATVSMPGYQTVQAQIDHRLSNGGAGAMAGNLLFGGIIGAGVDAASGANQDIRPNPLVLRLISGAGTVVLDWVQAERVSTANGDLTMAGAPEPVAAAAAPRP